MYLIYPVFLCVPRQHQVIKQSFNYCENYKIYFLLISFCSTFQIDRSYSYLGTIHKRRLPKGGGRGVQKMPKKETFTSRFEETRGGRVPQKSKIWGDVFYGWSLSKYISFLLKSNLELGAISYVRRP